MKNALNYFFLPISVLLTLMIFSSFHSKTASLIFPYKQSGLSDRQAAAHLLSRFTYGARPGELDKAVNMGLENWFLQQLKGNLADDSLKLMLKDYDAINLSNTEVLKLFPKNAQVLRMAVKDGIINKDSIGKVNKKDYRDQILSYMRQKGLKPQAELFRQLINQKILRAAYSNNQMQELLTEFWFNHFNVSITKNSCAEFIPAYERDVIRPNVFGNFEDLVLQTAKSPAMLMYLDNFSSSGTPENVPYPLNQQVQKRNATRLINITDSSKRGKAINKLQQIKKNTGLNENYAREVMELHTLGVDGGYTQSDVTQAARILTGWTMYPMGNNYGSQVKDILERIGNDNLEKWGFFHEGDFLFAASRHDTGEKIVLGRRFPENGGYQEGINFLKMLSNHPSAARFISGKIAMRFVNDNPSEKLTERMAAIFSKTNGNISEILLTMVSSPEFWNKEALREKTKSPFELAISAVRTLNAEIRQPYQLYSWINKMGQKIYYYQAPTGFPDQGKYWINTGSLLNRMNFGLALASQRISGVLVNLPALNKNREPESANAALVIYSKMIMPERDLSLTFSRLSPMLNDPQWQAKIEDEALKYMIAEPKEDMAGDKVMSESDKLLPKGKGKVNMITRQGSPATISTLSQVVGVILGSPEFQRR